MNSPAAPPFHGTTEVWSSITSAPRRPVDKSPPHVLTEELTLHVKDEADWRASGAHSEVLEPPHRSDVMAGLLPRHDSFTFVLDEAAKAQRAVSTSFSGQVLGHPLVHPAMAHIVCPHGPVHVVRRNEIKTFRNARCLAPLPGEGVKVPGDGIQASPAVLSCCDTEAGQ